MGNPKNIVASAINKSRKPVEEAKGDSFETRYIQFAATFGDDIAAAVRSNPDVGKRGLRVTRAERDKQFISDVDVTFGDADDDQVTTGTLSGPFPLVGRGAPTGAKFIFGFEGAEKAVGVKTSITPAKIVKQFMAFVKKEA